MGHNEAYFEKNSLKINLENLTLLYELSQVFVSLSWMAKAIVQAALGPVFLKRLHENPDATDDDKRLAEIMSMICVLSIILTAPIGALLISITGTKLLTKTKPLQANQGSFNNLLYFLT